jgi:pimeloyl-ACP methyl ester carboxylesterase
MEMEIIEEEEMIAGWKTDTVSIEWVSTERITGQNMSVGTHLLILFIPGNPGCVRWYIPMLQSIVEQLIEVGHHKAISVRGVSYAGHGVGLDKLQKISEPGKKEDGLSSIDALSVNGQIEHKIRWVDRILKVSGRPIRKLVFISHSIGSHLVQRICVLRPDILCQVVTVLHLMPFIRFDPSLASQRIPLSFVAHATTTSDPKKPLFLPLLEALSHISSRLPPHLLDYILLHGAGVVDKKGRDLASELVVQPAMARNFFTLGCEEIRDLPEYFDVSLW